MCKPSERSRPTLLAFIGNSIMAQETPNCVKHHRNPMQQPEDKRQQRPLLSRRPAQQRQRGHKEKSITAAKAHIDQSPYSDENILFTPSNTPNKCGARLSLSHALSLWRFISPVVNPRPDRDLRPREQLLYRHGHHVRRRVPDLQQLRRTLVGRELFRHHLHGSGSRGRRRRRRAHARALRAARGRPAPPDPPTATKRSTDGA